MCSLDIDFDWGAVSIERFVQLRLEIVFMSFHSSEACAPSFLSRRSQHAKIGTEGFWTIPSSSNTRPPPGS
jgi:hypothetical protein